MEWILGFGMLSYFNKDDQSEANLFLSSMAHKYCKICRKVHLEPLETCNSSAVHYYSSVEISSLCYRDKEKLYFVLVSNK